MKNDVNSVCRLFLDVVSEFYEADQKARTFGTGTELYHSEIQMLECVKDNSRLHISGLAQILGITRGAASQTVKRLERKGMLLKEANPTSGSKVVLVLTPEGETACQNHRQAHQRYEEILSGLLLKSGREDLTFLSDFLLQFEQKIREETTE